MSLGHTPSLRAYTATVALLCGSVLMACGDSHEAEPLPELPWARAAIGPVPEPADNPTSEAKVALGRLLFYDPILSRDEEVACVTCHSEIWGMGDGLVVSVGVDGEGAAGPGRHGPNVTRRNALTLWNVGYRTTLFWDGRAASLEEQALMPLAVAEEMDREVDELVADLHAIDAYRLLFEDAFDDPEPVSSENVRRALAALQRTFISTRAPYDRYASGDVGALNPQAIAGMWRFAEAGCADCHRPPLFSSDGFYARGAGHASDDDLGRFEVTGDLADSGRYRVPTLRNLRETGPYFHGGDVLALQDAVARESDRPRRDGSASQLDSQGIEDIGVFLNKGLMDRSQEPHRPDEVPSGLPVPLDGLRVPR